VQTLTEIAEVPMNSMLFVIKVMTNGWCLYNGTTCSSDNLFIWTKQNNLMVNIIDVIESKKEHKLTYTLLAISPGTCETPHGFDHFPWSFYRRYSFKNCDRKHQPELARLTWTGIMHRTLSAPCDGHISTILVFLFSNNPYFQRQLSQLSAVIIS
jgi:hypothetical protein